MSLSLDQSTEVCQLLGDASRQRLLVLLEQFVGVGRQVEQLQGCAQLLVDGELLLHIDVSNAIRER